MSDCHAASLYAHFFGLAREPFSISPDPRYLFMSPRHHEALAHLLYGASAGGGVVVLSGEIGTGKTTVCRCFLDRLPANCRVGYIFNPRLTEVELLQSICEEFRISPDPGTAAGVKDYVDALNRHLLVQHAEGHRSVLIIDEAQNLSIEVLEQLRLLTNLETNEHKLLQIILIGQPELRQMLARPELEQLAQRVIARYHLQALSPQETASYIQHRLATAGLASASPFQQPLMRRIHQLTNGIPRRINLLCDRALLGAYTRNRHQVERHVLEQAARELFEADTVRAGSPGQRLAVLGLLTVALAAGAVVWSQHGHLPRKPAGKPAAVIAPAAVAAAPSKPKAGALAAASAPAPNAIFSEQDGSPTAAFKNKDEALRQLALMWGASAPAGRACETVRQSGLHCYDSNGGFRELRQLDRPAVLTLHGPGNTSYYAILDGLDDVRATLRVGSIRQVVSLVILARCFSGEFSTLWRLPPAYGELVMLGDEGSEVDWIARQLAKASHSPAPPEGRHFDQALLKQVRDFQWAQGLDVDGVIGPATFMQINRVAGIQEPRLHSDRPIQAAPAKPGV